MMDRTVLIHTLYSRGSRETLFLFFFFFPLSNVYLKMKFSTLALAKAAGETESLTGTCVQTSLLLFKLVGSESA